MAIKNPRNNFRRDYEDVLSNQSEFTCFPPAEIGIVWAVYDYEYEYGYYIYYELLLLLL